MVEEQSAQNARRHFRRKIGYWRRSQFCIGGRGLYSARFRPTYWYYWILL